MLLVKLLWATTLWSSFKELVLVHGVCGWIIATRVRNLADSMDCASRKACNTNNLLYRSAIFKKSKRPSFVCDADSSVAHDASLGSGVGGLRLAMQRRFTKWGTVSQLFKRVSEYIWRGLPYVRKYCTSTEVQGCCVGTSHYSHGPRTPVSIGERTSRDTASGVLSVAALVAEFEVA